MRYAGCGPAGGSIRRGCPPAALRAHASHFGGDDLEYIFFPAVSSGSPPLEPGGAVAQPPTAAAPPDDDLPVHG